LSNNTTLHHTSPLVESVAAYNVASSSVASSNVGLNIVRIGYDDARLAEVAEVVDEGREDGGAGEEGEAMVEELIASTGLKGGSAARIRKRLLEYKFGGGGGGGGGSGKAKGGGKGGKGGGRKGGGRGAGQEGKERAKTKSKAKKSGKADMAVSDIASYRFVPLALVTVVLR
jgi:hypothetical protein